MPRIQKIYTLLIFFSVYVLFSSVFVLSVKPALADGIGIEISGEIIPEMAQKGVIIWDEANGTEVLILNASFGIDSLSDFCWIVPIQSDEDPNIRASDNEVFEYLEGIFPVNIMSDWRQYSASFTYGGSSAGIEIIEIKKIGVYDLAVIWANNANILVNWLKDNGYNVPNNFKNIVEDYIEKYDECYFIANKINMENEFSGPLDTLEDFSSGIYNGLMADGINLEAISDVIDDLKYAVAQYIKDNEPYVSSSFIGYIMDQADYEYLMDEWNDDDISSPELRDEIEEYLKETELFATIIKLFEGAGTPIEITFFPDKPTYPAYISSLANNFGGIDVYFIGPYEVVDENNILSRWAYAELTSSIESDLEDILDLNIPSKAINIIHLVYRGYMDDIDDDSVFIKYSQPSSTTPIYPIYPYYPYSPIISPYSYTMPYSYPTIPGYNLPSLFGGISFNLPFGGSGGFLGSYFGGIGGFYGTSFGGYGGGYNWPFSTSIYSGFPGSFGGMFGSSIYSGFPGSFGGMFGSSIYSGFPGSFGGMFGSSVYSGFPGSFGGLFGSSFFPSYARWPF